MRSIAPTVATRHFAGWLSVVQSDAAANSPNLNRISPGNDQAPTLLPKFATFTMSYATAPRRFRVCSGTSGEQMFHSSRLNQRWCATDRHISDSLQQRHPSAVPHFQSIEPLWETREFTSCFLGRSRVLAATAIVVEGLVRKISSFQIFHPRAQSCPMLFVHRNDESSVTASHTKLSEP